MSVSGLVERIREEEGGFKTGSGVGVAVCMGDAAGIT